ncbi:MAG TPA: acetoacetate decarboxylase family protein [Stellaceae bacterium]|nr:acetoacetate decarboxylase family protein [Stellaceae bacterium]
MPMHRYGTGDIKSWLAAAPAIASLKPEAWTLKGVHTMEARSEIDDLPADALVPPSLRPCMPAYCSIVVSRIPESPVGPFGLAEVRVAARVGPRPTFYLVDSFCDNEAARKELAARWGYRVSPGEVTLKEEHYRAIGTVKVKGKTVLELLLSHREPLPGTRFNQLPTINLCTLGGKSILAGLSIESNFSTNDKGRQHITLDHDAWHVGGALRLLNPMAATVGVTDWTMGHIEFTVDPAQAAEQTMAFVA